MPEWSAQALVCVGYMKKQLAYNNGLNAKMECTDSGLLGYTKKPIAFYNGLNCNMEYMDSGLLRLHEETISV